MTASEPIEFMEDQIIRIFINEFEWNNCASQQFLEGAKENHDKWRLMKLANTPGKNQEWWWLKSNFLTLSLLVV
jgi:hypothetical protein